MKKILSILLILLTLCLFLASCNNTPSDTDTSIDTITDTSTDTDTNTDTDTSTDTNTETDTNTDTNTNTNTETDTNADTNTDTDTETDTDTDTNTDTSTDTEADTDTDTDTDVDDNRVQAPNITILDYNGNEVALDSLKGKPIVLNFWASWCPPCKAEMPDFEEAYQLYGDEVLFVMVSHLAWGNDTVERAKAFYEQSGYTFPVYFDAKSEGYEKYGINGIPQTFFIDKDGYIQSYVPHMITKDELFRAIEEIK